VVEIGGSGREIISVHMLIPEKKNNKIFVK
jgi:hypothetical protein